MKSLLLRSQPSLDLPIIVLKNSQEHFLLLPNQCILVETETFFFFLI